MTADLESIRRIYLADRPTYIALAEFAARLLETGAHWRGLIYTRIDRRAKAMESLLRKVMDKDYSEYERVGDKAGVRVVAKYYSQLEGFTGLVGDLFDLRKVDDRRLEMAYDQQGYRGVNLDVVIPQRTVEAIADSRRFVGLRCEIQLHTPAQSAWADVAHDLAYKPPGGFEVPLVHKREIFRLNALAEIFDEEVDRTWIAMLQLPEFVAARMVHQLEPLYFSWVARPFDRRLSIDTLNILLPLFDGDDPVSSAEQAARQFFEANREKFDFIAEEYGTDERIHPLLFQPEAMVLFERIENDRHRLLEAWEGFLPEDLLRDLATIWGEDLPD